MNLKILEKKKEIIDAVQENDTVIIKAEPRTGKTTQVPQFLYDAGMRVIVVEPRMLEAYQAYSYVVKQRGLTEDNNTIIGCRTKKVYKNVDNFGILYCVGGFSIINKIKNGTEDMSNTVLIIDEAHEWKLPQEILMGWINSYRDSGHKLKIVFMSASINPKEINDYYKKLSSVSIIEIKGMQFPVSKHEIYSEYEGMHVALQRACIEKKSVLFFCSGKNEIEETIRRLKDDYIYEWKHEEDVEIEFIPLHGMLSFEEQEKAFTSSKNPKIIVCTNIAQSGVYFPISVVIDNGFEKQMRCINGVDTLIEVPISEEDRNQRMGRAGNTENGEYYIITNALADRDRPMYPVPEIQRLSLDKTIMKLIDMGIDPFEMQFFHQPSKISLQNSFDLLKKLGALDKANGKLTDIGKKMSMLPLSTQFARIIIEAEELGCMSRAIKAVAILETGSLLNNRYLRSNYSDYTDKYNDSDIIAEIDIFDKISNYEFGKDLKKVGIIKRNYLLIRNRIRNLRKLLENQGYHINSDSSDFDLISCFFSGMHMSLMENYYGSIREFQPMSLEIDYKVWKSTYASMLDDDNGDKFSIGIKQVIERRSGLEKINLLLFQSLIPGDKLFNLLKRYLPDDSRQEDVFEDYYPNTETISYRTRIYINGRCIRNKLQTVDRNNDEIYNKFKDEITKIEQRAKLKRDHDNTSVHDIVRSRISRNDGITIRIEDERGTEDTAMSIALKNAGVL